MLHCDMICEGELDVLCYAGKTIWVTLWSYYYFHLGCQMLICARLMSYVYCCAGLMGREFSLGMFLRREIESVRLRS